MIVALYLAAIVAANLIVTAYGPSVSVVTAFVFVAFDLTARDHLHDRWRGRRLWPRMALLIAAGSALAFVANPASAQIGLASCLAFAAASVADAMVYASLERSSWLVRVNGSNVVSSLVDSIVFPTIAFGAFLPAIVVGQAVAKIAGGALWSLVLRALPVRRRQA